MAQALFTHAPQVAPSRAYCGGGGAVVFVIVLVIVLVVVVLVVVSVVVLAVVFAVVAPSVVAGEPESGSVHATIMTVAAAAAVNFKILAIIGSS